MKNVILCLAALLISCSGSTSDSKPNLKSEDLSGPVKQVKEKMYLAKYSTEDESLSNEEHRYFGLFR